MHLTVLSHCQINQKQCSNSVNHVQTMKIILKSQIQYNDTSLFAGMLVICILLTFSLLIPRRQNGKYAIFSLLAFYKILIFHVSSDKSTPNEVITVQTTFWKLNVAGSSYVLLTVTCSTYGINHIGHSRTNPRTL